MYEEEFDKDRRRYELNKKHTHKEQDKRLKSPISKGSIRSQNKKLLQKCISNYITQEDFEEDEESGNFE